MTGFDNAAALELAAKLLHCGYEVQILTRGLSGSHQLAVEGVLAVFVCRDDSIAGLPTSTIQVLESRYRPLMICMHSNREAAFITRMVQAGFDFVLPLDVPAWELDIRIQNFVEREFAKASLRPRHSDWSKGYCKGLAGKSRRDNRQEDVGANV